MHDQSVWQVVGAALLAAALGFTFTAAARRIAPLLGLVDKPDGRRKLHGRIVPLMGGAAILGAWLLTLGVSAGMSSSNVWLTPVDVAEHLPLIVSAVLFCVLGLIDDRVGLSARRKFIGQILCAVPFVALGPQVDSFQLFGWEIPLGIWGAAFAMFWLVACSNVVNLIDGMDGLASTVGIIASLSLGAFSFLSEQYDAAILSWTLTASLVGFLIHNLPPAKIFLGDAGSLTIGFLVGALAMSGATKRATGFTLVVPLVIISVPVFDTFMAIMRRKLNGKRIGDADRGHIHHRLQDQGLDRRQALLVIAGLSAAMSAAAVASVYFHNDWIALLTSALVCCGLIAGGVFGRHETQLAFGHLSELTYLVFGTSRQLPSLFLSARVKYAEPHHHADFWEGICRRVGRMGAVSLEFRCVDARTGRVVALHRWTPDANRDGENELAVYPADSREGNRRSIVDTKTVRSSPFLHGDDANEVARTDSAVEWQFRYAAPRTDQLRVSMEVSGRAPSRNAAHRLDELFRLFDSFCVHWRYERQSGELPAEFALEENSDILPFIGESEHAYDVEFTDGAEATAIPNRSDVDEQRSNAA